MAESKTSETLERELYTCSCGWMALRLLQEEAGITHCYACSKEIEKPVLIFPLGAELLQTWLTRANTLDTEECHKIIDYFVVNELASLGWGYEAIPALYDDQQKWYA